MKSENASDTQTARLRFATLVVALALPTAITWLYFTALADYSPAIQQTAYSLGKAAQFLLPVLWIWLAKDRILWAWPSSRGVPLGLAFGATLLLAALAIYTFVLKPLGMFDGPAVEIRVKIRGMGLASLPAYIVLGVFYSLVHSLLEEYYWRWFVFGRLCTRMSLTAGIALSSLGFAAHHVLLLGTYFGWQSPATYLFAICVAIGGAFWAWLYHRSGSLLGPWFGHALVDAAIFIIGYDLAKDLLV
jgi:membrane protease YdiL (CAAX protease family)